MASSMIHIAIANEINKKINRDKYKLLIGTIAPDISKLVGQSKIHSHFLDSEDTDIPNIEKFLDKYKSYLNDDFVLGYYIHLYVDYLWFKYFLPKIFDEKKNMITKLDGSQVNCHGRMLLQYIYNDYTNLNTSLIDEYDLDLKIFYNEIPNIPEVISEIPMDRLDLIVNKAGEIIETSKVTKDLIFNLEDVKSFISLCLDVIDIRLKELKILK